MGSLTSANRTRTLIRHPPRRLLRMAMFSRKCGTMLTFNRL
jgi:hypothetical protein